MTLALTGMPSASANGQGQGQGQGALKYKGAESLELVSVAPNLARCGDFPNFEAHFIGEGIDEAGGLFTATSSGCQNVATGEVFDLTAVDTYADGSTVNIVAGSFTLSFNPATCASSNTSPILYFIDGGTGQFAGASGVGLFNFLSNDPSCNGELAPAFVYFEGVVN